MKILVQENKNDVVLIMIDHQARSEFYFTHELWSRFRETIGAPTEKEISDIASELARKEAQPLKLVHRKEGMPEI